MTSKDAQIDHKSQPTTAAFATGTLIETASGQRPIEKLKKGDRVMTANGIYQRVEAKQSFTVTPNMLAQNENLRPIRILAGALGHGLPKNDLLVSKAHRMLVSSELAYRLCGETDVLVPASRLTQFPGIFACEDTDGLEYFHLLFEEHEVIFTEGAPSESLYPTQNDNTDGVLPAAFIPAARKQKKLIARHVEHGKEALDGLY